MFASLVGVVAGREAVAPRAAASRRSLQNTGAACLDAVTVYYLACEVSSDRPEAGPRDPAQLCQFASACAHAWQGMSDAGCEGIQPLSAICPPEETVCTPDHVATFQAPMLGRHDRRSGMCRRQQRCGARIGAMPRVQSRG